MYTSWGTRLQASGYSMVTYEAMLYILKQSLPKEHSNGFGYDLCVSVHGLLLQLSTGTMPCRVVLKLFSEPALYLCRLNMHINLLTMATGWSKEVNAHIHWCSHVHPMNARTCTPRCISFCSVNVMWMVVSIDEHCGRLLACGCKPSQFIPARTLWRIHFEPCSIPKDMGLVQIMHLTAGGFNFTVRSLVATWRANCKDGQATGGISDV